MICRDCGHLFRISPDHTAERCPSCRSPRLLAHSELAELAVAHMDCDAFYASVEKRDNPTLMTQPVIVGGGQRGVVSAACYIARSYGVRSAMPIYRALNLCPDAVVIRPNIEKYRVASQRIRALMLAETDRIEPLALDEAFLDFTNSAKDVAPASRLARLARSIEDSVGVTVSIGLSYNKLLAKIASDLDKPRGFAVIGRSDALTFLADRPVSLLWGVGDALRRRLERDGIRTIGQLTDLSEITLVRRYGSIGRQLHAFARGHDPRRVTPDRPAKSISAETTFLSDVTSLGDLDQTLGRLAQSVARRLAAAGKLGGNVTLKLKSADFVLRSRSLTPPQPVGDADSLWRYGHHLLEREIDGTAFRLIGLGCDRLIDIDGAAPTLLD